MRVEISIIVGKVQTATEGYVLSCGITGAIYHMKLDLEFKSCKLKSKNIYTSVSFHTCIACQTEIFAHLSVYTPVRSHSCIQQETYKHLYSLFTRTTCIHVHLYTYILVSIYFIHL